HNTVDALLTANRQVLFTSDRPIPEMMNLHAGLRTRIQGGIVCPIASPDYTTRLAILRNAYRSDERKSDPTQIRWKDTVLRQVAARVTSHVRELFGAMHRLEVTQRLSPKSLTSEQVDRVLSELLRENRRAVRLSDVSRAVCKTFGLEEGGLQSDSRRACFSQPRMLAMWLARRYTRAALTEIGDFFGGRRHSTVISAQKRVDGWIESGDTLSFTDSPLRVEEAIHQIEESLRAG
ncbi:MAG: helix-turn-helix domain-containing protein, partial [Planctomycetia bacterium]|nr:helix-turn-helix domain-containing protein [Planctomycetia bacterium]